MAEPVRTVCVTGATGFIASETLRQLLAGGYRVHGTVRNLAHRDSHAHLRQLAGAAGADGANGADDRLHLFEADLLQPGSFDEAVQDCQTVFHMASPFALTVQDPRRDLVEPAVQGTRNVLESCRKTAGLRRVVLTSSEAALTDQPDSSHVLTEQDWNTRSTFDRNPYYLSKTLAEREAWRFVEQQKPGLDLVVINPFTVIGPSLAPHLCLSNRIFQYLMSGAYPAIMNLHFPFVDVRDVALAHIRAGELPQARGRYLCGCETLSMRDLVRLIRDSGYGEGRRLPRIGLDFRLGDWLVRLAAFRETKGIRDYLRTHVGNVTRFDNSKTRRDLGIGFRPLRETILETLADLDGWGHLPPAAK